MNPARNSREEYHNRIDRVVEYIIQNIDGDLSLATLAGVACFSPWHFHRIFSALMGETPDDYVRRVKLEKAGARLLNRPDLSVTEIASRSGFSTSALFSRNFRNYFGMSPTQFRGSRTNRQTLDKNGQAPGNNGKALSVLDRYYSTRNDGESNQDRAFPVATRRMAPTPIAYVWHSRGYFSGVGSTIERLRKWAFAHDILRPDSLVVGIGFDNPDITAEEKCRLLVGISIPETADRAELERNAGRAHVGFRVIPGGLYATWRHEGSGAAMKYEYCRFYRDWLPDSGYLPTDSEGFMAYDLSRKNGEPGTFSADVCMPITPF